MSRDGVAIARDAGTVAMRLLELYPSLDLRKTTAGAFAVVENNPSLSVDEIVAAISASVSASTVPEAAPAASDARTYHVGLVGERSYQSAIRACNIGEAVTLVHEPDNPYDDAAIAAFCPRDRKLGYVPRSSWLRDAVLEEGKGCTATIASMHATDGGPIAVVLDVALGGVQVAQRAFVP